MKVHRCSVDGPLDDFDCQIQCEEYYMDEETLDKLEDLLYQLDQNHGKMNGVMDRMELALSAAIQACDDAIKNLENETLKWD